MLYLHDVRARLKMKTFRNGPEAAQQQSPRTIWTFFFGAASAALNFHTAREQSAKKKRAMPQQKLKGYGLFPYLILVGYSLSRLLLGENVIPCTNVQLFSFFVQLHSLNFSTRETNSPRVLILCCDVHCVGVRPVRAILSIICYQQYLGLR